MEFGPPRVNLRVEPRFGAHLLAWGRAPGGDWQALIVWERHAARGFAKPERIICSGWTPAETVVRMDEEDYSRVPRVQLDANPAWWPAPPGGRGRHVGQLDGRPIEPPPGMRWCAPRT